MRERQPLDELSSAVSLGLVAEDMVLAIGRVMRQEPLRPKDRLVLEAVRKIFDSLASAEVVLTAPSRDQMLPDRAYLHALRALEAEEPDEEVQEVAARVVALLDEIQANRVGPAMSEQLLELREIFVNVGKATLVRANDLSRTRQESYSWRPTQAISSF